MSKSVFAAACLGIKLLATGCLTFPVGLPVAAIVPRASPEADALAKAYQTNPSKAGIYIYRNDRNLAYKIPVLLDNVWVGDTASKTYIFRQVDAGPMSSCRRRKMMQHFPWMLRQATTTSYGKSSSGASWHLALNCIWLTKPQERQGSQSASWCSEVWPNKRSRLTASATFQASAELVL